MNAPLPPLSKLIKIPGIASPVQSETISHFEGFGNYSRLFFLGKSAPVVVSQTLKLFELQLPNFLRVSKSHLVNPQHIISLDSLKGRSNQLTLSNEVFVPVSRRRIDGIRTQLSVQGVH
ncbi:LytTR family DNA-binding domain-containing protein [Spirosoma oryzicola]|uniref:LytTR family DNA-binding domain-containing protein n=1 Tax=Spirosoma oryzicola TaxID=2898794 RepID=UPI001E3579BC|nr:LytTR family DNA-binding domain-containing protein [Spirosoma oryzicola]UHG94414.1 LytTR family transcriptional regulator [Spirosoma oryzicola]